MRTSVSVKCTSASKTSIGKSYSPSHHISCCPCLFAFSDAEVTSHGTGQTHKLQVSATCKSYDIVYVIQGERCGQQDLGETEQALHERLNSHRLDIQCGKISEKPVAGCPLLFKQTLSDLSVLVVAQLHQNDVVLLKNREFQWMLQTEAPNRTNLHVDRL